MCIEKITKNIYNIIKTFSNLFEKKNDILDNNILDNNILDNNILDNNILDNNILDNNILDNDIINDNISMKNNKSIKISSSLKVKNNINNFKDKVEIIVQNSLKKYKSNNYTLNPTINEFECYIALNLLEELYSMTKKENYDICDDIIKNIIISIKYMLNHLSKNKNIDLLNNNELKNLLCNVIIDIIDDSSDILNKIL
jgi:hypothetical protein